MSCAALADLYDATDGPNWANNDGWRDAAASISTSYCTFAGVRCKDGAILYLCVSAHAHARCMLRLYYVLGRLQIHDWHAHRTVPVLMLNMRLRAGHNLS